MSDAITAALSPRDELAYAARMTNIQFAALAGRLEPDRLTSDLRDVLARRTVTRGNSCNLEDVSRWLINGWNTEYLLKFNATALTADALRHSLHWAFPQAYYSAFALTLAYYKTVGFTEESHAAAIRKFGMESLAGHYPAALSCAATGATTRVFHGLACTRLPTALHFDPADPDSIDGQIAQFLGATRSIDLKAKKSDLKLQTKRGTRKKAFSPDDWSQVSKALGPTSILSLLYRKRIKANYRDIDTFLHPELQAEVLYRHLLRLLGALNCTHETLIARALGVTHLEAILARLPDAARERPQQRLPIVRGLAA